jgi:hypothetical protein
MTLGSFEGSKSYCQYNKDCVSYNEVCVFF